MDLPLMFPYWSDIQAWVWTHAEESRCKLNKTWYWWYNTAYTRHHNTSNGWGTNQLAEVLELLPHFFIFQTVFFLFPGLQNCRMYMAYRQFKVIEDMELNKATWYYEIFIYSFLICFFSLLYQARNANDSDQLYIMNYQGCIPLQVLIRSIFPGFSDWIIMH